MSWHPVVPAPAVTAPQYAQPGQGSPSGAGGVITTTVKASVAIGGHRAVVLNASSEAIYADKSVSSHAGRVYGITTNAAAAGGSLAVRLHGAVSDVSWTWTPNLPVFLSTTGLLTQTPPTSGFQQVLGIALNATTLFVQVREPLILV